MSGRIHFCLPCSVYLAYDNVNLVNLIVWVWVCVHVVVSDFLSCSLWSDSLTNCGSSGWINFLTQQATVAFPDWLFLSDAAQDGKKSGQSKFLGRITSLILTRIRCVNHSKYTINLYLSMCAHGCIFAAWIAVMSEYFNACFKEKYPQMFREIHFDDTCKLSCKLLKAAPAVSCGSYSW